MAVMALSAGRCKCASDKGPANLLACQDVNKARTDLQTFLTNHPINGTPDPQSQVGVLGHMISQLQAAKNEGPDSDLSGELGLAIDDATQMQADISAGRPVTSAKLISDFDNLASMCGGSGSDLTVP
jgi:hypothetical protein